MAQFAERVVLVTGGSSGIGAAAARAFQQAGAQVIVGDLDPDTAGAPDAILVENLDVTDRAAVDRFIADAVQRHGRLDVLVNSAGIREITPMLDLELAEWSRVLAVNLEGVFNTSQAFARAVRDLGTPASIVNVASVAGLMGVPDRAAYVASKHGVVGLTKEMAMELGPLGIRVNAIAPGSVRTPLTERYFGDPALVERLNASHPLGRVAAPEEISAAILFAASDDAGFMTGAVVPVDGGYAAGKAW